MKLLANIAQNRPFTLIMLAISVIQLLFVYLGGSVLRTAPLLPEELTAAICAALLVFPAELLRKLIWKLFVKKSRY
jgi:hypothetical protein